MTEKKNIIFDATILNEIQLCGKRTKFAHEMNLRLPSTPTPLEEGDLLHKMLEYYYNKIKQGGTELIYSDESFGNLVTNSMEFGQEYSLEKDLTPEEASTVIYQFEAYSKHYRMDGLVPEYVEEPFIVPLYSSEDLDVFMTGKIDIIGNVPNFGRSVIDHKKASRTQAPSSLSNQFTNYSFATGCKTVIVNKIGFQKTLPPEERFRRYPIFYTDSQIERWKANTVFWAQQYAFYIENDTWPENRTSCDKFGGCIYSSICESATDEARNWLIQTKFVIGDKWDVTKSLEEKNNG